MSCIAMRPWCGVGGKFCIACAQQQPRRDTTVKAKSEEEVCTCGHVHHLPGCAWLTYAPEHSDQTGQS